MGSSASPGPQDAARILNGLRRIVRHLQVVARTSETRAGVAPGHLFVLARLADEPAASVRTLAARTLTDPSSVSDVLARLETRKLVVRRADPRDKRRAQFTLTAKGRAVLRRAPEPPQVRLASALAALSAERQRTVADALTEIVAGLGAGRAEPRLLFDDGLTPAAGERPSRRQDRRTAR